ncbi:PLD nuclease N-terminal domain-containing protein [Gramella lutea]|uniref:PLD nuclease N-terminal domain-containing protein n=1 Tax=Christiangramia lutea TaxID=1607951 RepID=A0A9X1V0L0_9FLAO|nr:PLD nuclease N-terminal domain-containing protein [Christiangramia lutea]MCH4822092.1 PLD nuclease N-terminal domain-containing protein [Christiangramia lutea]
MPGRLLFIASVLMMLMSCSKDHKNVSRSEFIKIILPEADVQNVTVKDENSVLIKTDENAQYRVEVNSAKQANEFIKEIESQDNSFSIIYDVSSEGIGAALAIWQFLYFLFPALLLAHVVLLWVALRKIIRSGEDGMHKILYAMISIFFPFFGPIIYLKAKKRSGYR